MADGRVRWGVLSAAKIAREWVVPGIHMSDRGELAAVASLTPGKAEALVAPYGGVRIHKTYEALLADAEVDAIYIPLPNHQHVEWTAKCLAAGKHVLCEKPLALKAEEIDGLIALRDRTGLLAAEAFMVTHHPQWIRARQLVRQGAIGRLRQVQGAFTFFNEDPGNIRNRADMAGGALRDIGVYPSISARFVTGEEPTAVTHATIEWDRGIDATARIVAKFPSFDMDFYVSMRMAPRQIMTFHGETGWLSVHAPYNAGAYGDPVIELRNAEATVVLERFPRSDHYRSQIDAFNASVLDGVPYACPLEFSRGNQVMIDMIYAAAGSPL
ncbi:MAG TPA: Gfo/Idh/MocA family oxidoreductase [Amaricoccus sp.]|nr:Gfo/Idh/MocA family oxidoreductase [Amaricoccus sp.]